MTVSRQLNVLLVTTQACNLACRYCYISPARRDHLEFERFVALFENLDAFFPDDTEFNIVFHGGEPLLLGIDFYRRVFAYLAGKSRRVQTTLQSNLLLLDDRLLALFKEHGTFVGTSIDGSREMHDANRVHPDGRGSYDEVLDRVRTCCDAGVPCGVIVTLNRENIADPVALYESLRPFQGMSIGFSPMYLPVDEHGLIPRPGELGRCLSDLFDIWVADPYPLKLRFFENIVSAMLDMNNNPTCTFSGRCPDFFLAIDALGNVFPCCNYEGDASMSYGNAFTDPMERIWGSKLRERLSRRLGAAPADTALARCRACEFYRLCHGGCMVKARDPFRDHDRYCQDYRALFAHMQGVLADVAPRELDK